MDIGLILLTLLCFVGGIAMSRWQAKRHLRAHMSDRMAQEAEKELARQAVEKIARQGGLNLSEEAVQEIVAKARDEARALKDKG